MDWDEVDAWRKAERERMAAARLGMSVDERAALTRGIIAQLDEAAGAVPGLVISGYFPFRGEPDLRPWMVALVDRGVRVASPVVTQRHAPLSFRLWTPAAKLTRGVLGIPIPADTASVVPNVVIAPCLAFDSACYRLGYGGGYFDRTLASFREKPLAIGVAFSRFQIETIHPQPHDVPMDKVVTERAVIRKA
ncbi:5-formyltetrahydrofolate cyclo-ligase [Rhodoligotrophos defluvii]|uniref:5-formyltetrahydrofolate cyclo-ligase n=1 Tax=Rhodoligotrophos defluvii TaxID=2561934 RepID=UPI001EF03C5C|nr:5-formyltetrahydrofolate cyclo-ligase [Rhodoligotrophos defluvii]